MDARALDRYIGIPYCEQTMDCADLAVLVQAELFGRAINIPGRRQRMAAPRAAIERMVCGTGWPASWPTASSVTICATVTWC